MCICFDLASIRTGRNVHHRKRAHLQQAPGKSASTSGSRFVNPGAQHRTPNERLKNHVQVARGTRTCWWRCCSLVYNSRTRASNVHSGWNRHATQRERSYLLRCIQPQGMSYCAFFPPSISAFARVVWDVHGTNILSLKPVCFFQLRTVVSVLCFYLLYARALV